MLSWPAIHRRGAWRGGHCRLAVVVVVRSSRCVMSRAVGAVQHHAEDTVAADRARSRAAPSGTASPARHHQQCVVDHRRRAGWHPAGSRSAAYRPPPSQTRVASVEQLLHRGRTSAGSSDRSRRAGGERQPDRRHLLHRRASPSARSQAVGQARPLRQREHFLHRAAGAGRQSISSTRFWYDSLSVSARLVAVSVLPSAGSALDITITLRTFEPARWCSVARDGDTARAPRWAHRHRRGDLVASARNARRRAAPVPAPPDVPPAWRRGRRRHPRTARRSRTRGASRRLTGASAGERHSGGHCARAAMALPATCIVSTGGNQPARRRSPANVDAPPASAASAAASPAGSSAGGGPPSSRRAARPVAARRAARRGDVRLGGGSGAAGSRDRLRTRGCGSRSRCTLRGRCARRPASDPRRTR